MTSYDFSTTFLNQRELPLVIQAQNEKQRNYSTLIQFLKNENTLMKEQLLKYGAVLFRGFQVDSSDKFLEAINACSLGPIFNYDLCAVPRTKIQEGIYTSINCHENYIIPMHNEKSYHPEFPSHIYFNCIQEPATGGATPLVDGHQLWLSLPETLQQKLLSKGILYRRFYYGNGFKHKFVNALAKGFRSITWMSTFNTENKQEVEQQLKNQGLSFRWTKINNGLITERILPAVRHHPVTQKIVWFNQSDHNNYYCNGRSQTIQLFMKNPLTRFLMLRKIFVPHVAFYGDGETISKQDSEQMNKAIQSNIISTPWQQGDFLVVDNYSCMHGKMPHTGERLILAGMTGQTSPVA